MSVETPEPLSDELVRLLPHLDERVGQLVEHHRARLERRFAERLLGLLREAADAADPTLRPAYESMIRLVRSAGGVES